MILAVPFSRLLAVPHLKMIPGISDDSSGKYVAATLFVDTTGLELLEGCRLCFWLKPPKYSNPYSRAP